MTTAPTPAPTPAELLALIRDIRSLLTPHKGA